MQMPVQDDWCVLIEENTAAGEYSVWALTHVRVFRSRADAVLDASIMARQYQPRILGKIVGRWIFRTGEDIWTVQVRGKAAFLTRDVHFRISVAKPEPV